MKPKLLIVLCILTGLLLLAALVIGGMLFYRYRYVPTMADTTTAAATEATTVPETTPPATTEETTEAVTEETTEATEPPPQEEYYTLSFAGDCTLGNSHGDWGSPGSFIGMIGDHYEYPFLAVRNYFGTDDFTMVNFEGTLTTSRAAEDKKFVFHAPPAYARILTIGSVDAVSLANNHSYDYGYQGYIDTQAALDKEGILYAGNGDTFLFTTDSGLTIGVYANSFWWDVEEMAADIQQLEADGAEIIVASFHWGIERDYYPCYDQIYYAHAAIDAGADIIFGHHPHVLQNIEYYKDGIIYYSLGNFSFGGNHWPDDMDTAVLQQEVIRDIDGTVRLGELTIIPCRLSSITARNDFQPTPYAVDDPGYQRVLKKLEPIYNEE